MPATSRRVPLSPALGGYIGALGLGAIGITAVLAHTGAHGPGRTSWTVLPILTSLLIVAEYLLVRFRYKQEVDALNLIESVLAPMLFAFPGAVVVGAMFGSQVLGAVLRRRGIPAIKSAFNACQWAFAVGVGALVLDTLSRGPGVSVGNLAASVLATVCVGVVNQIAIIIVLAIANEQPVMSVLVSMWRQVLPAWSAGLSVNVLIGTLYILAYNTSEWAVVLFPVPLVVMHLAYRGYAAARSERARLTGLHRSAQALSEPLDPREAIEGYLREVAACFEARGAALVLLSDGGRDVHTFLREKAQEGVAHRFEERAQATLEGALLAQPRAVRIGAGGAEALGADVAAAGWHDCASAPLYDSSRLVGVLVVYDQSGLEGSLGGELAVLEAMAREAAGTFAKGRLLESVLEERRKLAEIVGSTSDGILTLTAEGTVRSWNEGFEAITGITAEHVIGRGVREALRDLNIRGLAPGGVELGPVELAGWAGGGQLPEEVRIERSDGQARRLACSYSHAEDEAGTLRTLVIVARDVTPGDEMEALRAQFERLVELEAAQRLVVEQLQDTVMPERPEVDGVDMVVEYLPSDPSAPTGGDLYDWQLLPSGELHLAVVDVLGHGVGATKDALAVVHALRLLSVQDDVLETTVARADAMLGALHPDLVATVILARYNPETGRVRVASGGHPAAIIASPRGDARQVGATGGAIGWPGAGSDGVAEDILEPGDSLILYTDGLVEARKDILEGMEVLVGHAGELAGLPAGEYVRALVERSLAGASRRDDTLALVLRRCPVSARAGRKQWRVAPDKREATHLRREIQEYCAQRGADNPDVITVAAELLANAVEFARTEVHVHVEVEGAGAECEVLLEVSDDGLGSEILRQPLPTLAAPSAEHGRGLYIVRALSTDVSILSTSEGSIIRCAIPGCEHPGDAEAEAALGAMMLAGLDLEGLDL